MIRSHDVIVSAHQTVARATIYPAAASRRGIALLSSSNGDPHDPSGVFEELALYCQSAGITACHFRLRAPQLFVPTVLDLRAVVGAMSERGVERVVLLVEASSRRSAAYAPIAYRSIVGLVEKVIGVATILPAGGEQMERLPRSLPSDLVFLLRSARSRPGGPPARRELTRADGLSELFLAPGPLHSRADGLSAIIAPVFSWAQRTLQHPPLRIALPAMETPLPPELAGGRRMSAGPLQEGDCRATAPVLRSSVAGRHQGTSTTYREVCAWLVQEWRRILNEQIARNPSRAMPPQIAWRLPPEELSARELLHWFAGLRRYLDRVAQVEWIDAYVHASRMVAEMTAIGASNAPTGYSERGA